MRLLRVLVIAILIVLKECDAIPQNSLSSNDPVQLGKDSSSNDVLGSESIKSSDSSTNMSNNETTKNDSDTTIVSLTTTIPIETPTLLTPSSTTTNPIIKPSSPTLLNTSVKTESTPSSLKPTTTSSEPQPTTWTTSSSNLSTPSSTTTTTTLLTTSTTLSTTSTTTSFTPTTNSSEPQSTTLITPPAEKNETTTKITTIKPIPLDTTTSENITTTSEISTTTSQISTTTTTKPIDYVNLLNDVIEEPQTGCFITETYHNLSESNIITVNWILNTTIQSCITPNVHIWIKDLACEKNCNASDVFCIPANCSDCVKSCKREQYVNVTELTYTFSGPLKPCAEYNYMIGYRGIYNFSEPFRTFKNISAIQKPTNLYVFDEVQEGEENVLDLTVTWEYGYECDQEFQVNLINGGSNNLDTTKNFNMTFANVTACTNYTIQVSPIGENNNTESIQFSTRSIIPSSIRNFNISSTIENEVVVINAEWTAPTYGAQCINSYRLIAITENQPPLSVDERCCAYKFTNVYSCANYNITIRPSSEEISRYIDGIAEQILLIKAAPVTLIDVPVPNVLDKTDSSFTLNANPGNSRNLCEISEYEFKCVNEDKNSTIPESNSDLPVNITGLEPYTDYNCSVRIKNEAGWSDFSGEIKLKTKEGRPNAPNLNVETPTSSSAFTITWEEPTSPKGEIKSYNINIRFIKYLYYNPPYCSHYPNDRDSNITLGVENRTYTFNNASASSIYSISIQAINGEQEGEISQASYLQTLPDISDPVVNFTIKQNDITLDPYNQTVALDWKSPCSANGNISFFEIEINSEIFNTSFQNKRDNYQHFLELDPNIEYTVKIYPHSHEKNGREIVKYFQLTPGIPSTEHVNNLMSLMKVKSTAKKEVTLSHPPNLFDPSVGKVERIVLLIHQTDCQKEVTLKRNLLNFDDFESLPFWKNVSHLDCVPQYRAKGITSLAGSDDSFIIGSDNCNDYELCNGPLKPGTSYALTMRFYTKSGFSDCNFIKFDTDKEIAVIPIVISFLVIMIIVFAIGFYLTYTKPRNQTENQFDREDVPVQFFPEFHNQMIKNESEKMKEEYRAVNFFAEGIKKEMLASKVNANYNRYANIQPFDPNRVVLNDDEFEHDYINASFVNGYYYPNEYIATQGPRPNTSHDFWRMVLQYKTESIVMLTSLVENNKIKCHEYFPRLNGRVIFENIQIVCTSEQKYPNYVKRILEVQKDDIKHQVKHYYFIRWMDHSACNAIELIDFVKLIRSERERPKETFIVHCSAGVGRTGSFIAVDIIMQRIKEERKVNIFGLVKQLRNQRMKMVQTFDQYALVYDAALEMTTVRTRRPRVMENFSKYIENIELFKNWTRRGNNAVRDNQNNESTL